MVGFQSLYSIALRRAVATAFAASATLLGPVRPLSAGILGDAASETRKERESASPNDDDPCDCDDDDDGFGEFLWDLTIGTMLETVFGPSEKRLGQDACGRTVVTRWYAVPQRDDIFAPFPYSQDTPGIIVPIDRPHVDSYLFSGRFAFEYGNDFDALDRFAGSALVEWRSGLGFDASGHVYREDLGAGEQDELSVGDVNLLWRMVQTERTQWRLGIGANWLADSIDAEAGLNFTLRADYFPARPFILSGEIDYGTIGSASMFHGRASVGVNIQQVEFFLGYDHRAIGDVEIAGPMLGVQLWY